MLNSEDQTPMSLLSPKQAQETKEDDIEQKQQQQQQITEINYNNKLINIEDTNNKYLNIIITIS